MQFGTPMTIIKGGIKLMIRFTGKSNKAMVPNDQMTPVPTTIKLTPVTNGFRKNTRRSNIVTSKAAPMNQPISFLTLLVIWTRMNGSPLIDSGTPCRSLHSSAMATTSSTTAPLCFESNSFGFMKTESSVASCDALKSSPS